MPDLLLGTCVTIDGNVVRTNTIVEGRPSLWAQADPDFNFRHALFQYSRCGLRTSLNVHREHEHHVRVRKKSRVLTSSLSVYTATATRVDDDRIPARRNRVLTQCVTPCTAVNMIRRARILPQPPPARRHQQHGAKQFGAGWGFFYLSAA